jgi:hypothetical protein
VIQLPSRHHVPGRGFVCRRRLTVVGAAVALLAGGLGVAAVAAPGRAPAPPVTTDAATTDAATTDAATTDAATTDAAVATDAATGTVAAAKIQLPPKGAKFDYQLGGATTFTPVPAVAGRDNGDKPWPGVYSICYINGFQSQAGDSSLKPYFLKDNGKPVEDPNWPGEYVLDTHRYRSQLLKAFTPIIAGCAKKGFKAVEFDNLDSFDRSHHLLTAADNLAFARSLIKAGHANGLAVAQKNAVELAGKAPFDFAVAEECLVWNECSGYTKHFSVVFDIEYKGELSTSAFKSGCKREGDGTKMSFVYRDLDLTPHGTRMWCDGSKPTS